jgi:hypothetical protein
MRRLLVEAYLHRQQTLKMPEDMERGILFCSHCQRLLNWAQFLIRKIYQHSHDLIAMIIAQLWWKVEKQSLALCCNFVKV